MSLEMEGGVVRMKIHRPVWLAVLGALAALGIGVSAALMLAPSPAPAAPAYLLKDHGGKLALYAADGGGLAALPAGEFCAGGAPSLF